MNPLAGQVVGVAACDDGSMAESDTAYPAPKVFISHASEDKERFVLAFAERLRSDGVDAWLDKWEMAPGDSLVSRIFEEGIGGADVFLVVLSGNSLDKPWVREELNAGVVQRIEGACKLIPVVLDGVQVPVALKATVWQSVADVGAYEEEYRRILAAIFGVSSRPPLGDPPSYAHSDPVPGLTTSDSIVLVALAEASIERGDRFVPGEDLTARCAPSGLDDAAVRESVHALDAGGLVEEAHEVHGGRFAYVKPSWSGLLRYLASSQRELGDVQQRLVAHLVNDAATSFELADMAKAEGVPQIVAEALMTPFESRGLVTVSSYLGGRVTIRNVSPLLRRELE